MLLMRLLVTIQLFLLFFSSRRQHTGCALVTVFQTVLFRSIFFNDPLGRSLELIAASKGEAFYRGELADRVVRFAGEHGAALTRDDLATHTADWCGTISTRFRDVDLHEIPPNGQDRKSTRLNSSH